MVCNDCYVNLDTEEDTERCDDCGSEDIHVYPNTENCDGKCHGASYSAVVDSMSRFGCKWAVIADGYKNKVFDIGDTDYRELFGDTANTQEWTFGGSSVTVILRDHDTLGATYAVRPASVAQVVQFFDDGDHQILCSEHDHHPISISDDGDVVCSAGHIVEDPDAIIVHTW